MQQASTDNIVARYTFTPERASEFDLAPGQLIQQQGYDDIDEVIEDLRMFGDAVVDCRVIFANGRELDLTDYPKKD